MVLRVPTVSPVITPEQTLILMDEGGRPRGYAPRSECHRGEGLRHGAIAVLLTNTRGEVLLQQRRSPLWDGWWDITGATHPLHLAGRDETFEEATLRCLRAEWHVEAAVAHVLDFTYFDRFGEWAENEYCALYRAQHDGSVEADGAFAYGMRWTPLHAALAEARSPDARFTPWARIALTRYAAALASR